VNTSTRFILVNTSHSGNVGAAARALKVMGFSAPGQLVLLDPRYENVKAKADAISLASGALDVLEGAQICHSWEAALGDAQVAVALTARGRDFGAPAFALRELCEARAALPERVAFVFGSERFGLPNEIIYKCHAIAHIPANPLYSSLNLAQSLMLVTYEWRQALNALDPTGTQNATDVPASPPQEPRAGAVEVEGLLKHWEQALVRLKYLDVDAPKKLMPRLQRALNRAQLSEQEVHILRGVAKAILDKTR
jgi:tRNA/rRNA methyltransferase